MPTPHSKPLPRCPVYLHPTAASNPTVIARIQRRTGLRVIVGDSNKAASLRPSSIDFGPFEGDAA
ncbi:hypothetical protein ACFOJE_20305 [Azotobacter bryophylli]|uniref:GST N-terminal domain-containing protein n=1 Tax=Azotobacter bryophylli TaxID=1986537 RepID=A0ABV7AY67_9GAMM